MRLFWPLQGDSVVTTLKWRIIYRCALTKHSHEKEENTATRTGTYYQGKVWDDTVWHVLLTDDCWLLKWAIHWEANSTKRRPERLLYLACALVLVVLSCVAACVCIYALYWSIQLQSCKCVYNELTYLLTRLGKNWIDTIRQDFKMAWWWWWWCAMI